MNFTGPVYRPPFEARSLLLQVTVGCSHNRCAFCTMYRGTPFRAEPLEQIEADLREAAEFAPYVPRVFLENGDPFCLSAQRLEAIAELVHRYLPAVETVAMYASIQNIRDKTDEDLKRLRSLGVNELNIGVESGFDPALRQMNKGYTAEEALFQLKRLRRAGIDYGANVIFGAAGAEHWRENAEATAALLNETEPYLIFTGTVHADPGCPLYEEMRSGAFQEPTFGQYLDEEALFLRELDLKGSYYFGVHPSNIVPLNGELPREKETLLRDLKSARQKLETHLNERPLRNGEGAILLLRTEQ